MSERIPLGELVDPDSLTVPVGPFDALLDGERLVVVTAVLERTAVYHPTNDNSDRKTALFARLLVDPDSVPMVERRDPARDAAARGRANAAHIPKRRPSQTKGAAAQAFNQGSTTTHGGRDMAESHRHRIDELREETVKLRSELEREAQAAELGRDLARLAANPDAPPEEWLRLRERATELAAQQGAA